MSRGRVLAVLVLAAACALVAGCTAPSTDRPGAAPSSSPPVKTSPTPSEKVTLRFLVYGEPAQLAAYYRMADRFEHKRPDVTVEVHGAPTAAAAMTRLDRAFAAGHPPDVFLIERESLPALMAQGRVHPVNELLQQRKLDFGDGYQRDGLEAFSADNALQCMPHDVSPLVVYYNKELVDFRVLTVDGRRVTGELGGPLTAADGWTFEEFRAAAVQAAHGRADGVAVDASLLQLAPFIWSAGGDLVDDRRNPTTLTLSAGDAKAALTEVLDLVREARITPSAEELARQDAVTRFARGKLGMILGTRELTPRLRAAKGLRFDVFPLPRIGAYRTVSDMTGYCLAAGGHVQQAADFLAFAVGDVGAAITTRPGYVMPSNVDVAHSPAFQQPGRMPESFNVFNEGVRHTERLPLGASWTRMLDVAQPYLEEMFYQPVIDLDAMLETLDTRSRSVLAPPSASPTE